MVLQSVTYFILGFYNVVLDKRVDLKDLEAVDYELYKGLTWMLCVLIVVVVVVVVTYASFRHRVKDITDAQEETLSVMQDRFGEHVVVELRPEATHQT